MDVSEEEEGEENPGEEDERTEEEDPKEQQVNARESEKTVDDNKGCSASFLLRLHTVTVVLPCIRIKPVMKRMSATITLMQYAVIVLLLPLLSF